LVSDQLEEFAARHHAILGASSITYLADHVRISFARGPYLLIDSDIFNQTDHWQRPVVHDLEALAREYTATHPPPISEWTGPRYPGAAERRIAALAALAEAKKRLAELRAKHIAEHPRPLPNILDDRSWQLAGGGHTWVGNRMLAGCMAIYERTQREVGYFGSQHDFSARNGPGDLEPHQRTAASAEWSRQLRAKVAATAHAKQHQVVVDLECVDDF
jgi:hypothetical protein